MWAVHPANQLPQDEADEDRQLALYQLGVRGAYPDAKRIDLVWHYLRHDRELRSNRSPDQLAGLAKSCVKIMDRIDACGKGETAFQTSPSALCRWCEFERLCPAMDSQR